MGSILSDNFGSIMINAIRIIFQVNKMLFNFIQMRVVKYKPFIRSDPNFSVI